MSNSAVFPGAVATDATLKVAANNVLTSLRGSLNASSTVVTVADASAISEHQLITVDREVMSVTSSDGVSTLVVVRGFDGTTAAAHRGGAPIYGYVVAYHHNQLVEEIKAIQNSLGVGLGNVSGFSPGTIPERYAWTAQQPGGSLIVGANSISLSPVPDGIDATYTWSYVYISGGTGTAEACRIIGGTAVSGSSSGTIIVECAHTHSGAWTVGPATSGWQEAVNVAASTEARAIVQAGAPAGGYVFYAPCAYRGNALTIRGAGALATYITATAGSFNVFEFDASESGLGQYNSITGLSISGSPTRTSGYGISLVSQNGFTMDCVLIDGMGSGVRFFNCIDSVLRRVGVRRMTNTTGIGILVDGDGEPKAECAFERIVIDGGAGSTAAAGILLKHGGGFKLLNVTAVHAGNGLIIGPDSGQEVCWLFGTNCDFDTCTGWGARIAPANGGVAKGITFLNSWAASNEQDGWIIEPQSGGVVSGVRIIGSRAIVNDGNGINVAGGDHILLSNNTVAGNSASSPGTSHGIVVQSAATQVSLIGNQVGGGENLTETQDLGVLLNGATFSDVVVTGNLLSGNLGNGLALTPGDDNISVRIEANLFDAADYYGTVASASSVEVVPTVDLLYLSGTTTVNTLTPSWPGKRLTIVFTNASPGGFGSSGNFSRALSATQNVPIFCTFADGKWFCK